MERCRLEDGLRSGGLVGKNSAVLNDFHLIVTNCCVHELKKAVWVRLESTWSEYMNEDQNGVVNRNKSRSSSQRLIMSESLTLEVTWTVRVISSSKWCLRRC
jgi:hypothetical protein